MSELDDELTQLANQASSPTKTQGGDEGNNTNTSTSDGTGATTEVSSQQPAPQANNAHWEKFWQKAETQNQPDNTTETTDTQKVGTSIGTPEPKNIGTGRLSKAAIENGATTVVGAINLGLLTVARPLLKWRTNKEIEKRFGKNSTRAMELYMDDLPPADQRERSIKKRFDKLMKERDRKITGIPLSDEEEADLKYSLKQYFEMKQVAMSPELMLYISAFTVFGKRAVDIAMWD